MRTLLIADDERTIREGIAASIDWASLGISRVFLAADGREAYETIMRERPAIALIDILMPEMTGMEVIARCAENGPEFVIISGYGEFDYAREAIRHRVKNYILKPCDAGEITETIKRIIADLDARRSIEEERRHLKEHIDRLVPQAREQILRDYLTGAATGGPELFAEVFGWRGEELMLLLLCPEDADDPARLLQLRKCLARVPGLPDWNCGTILHDGVVLVFAAEAAAGMEDLVQRIAEAQAGSSPTGLRAALSGQGSIADLPEMYKKTWEAVEFLLPLEAGQTRAAVTLIDASTARYGRIIQRVIQYVRANLEDPALSLHRIAAHVLYLNPEYLGRLFKKACGIKFSDYLMRLRMERAKQLITMAGELKLYEVARQVGLGDNAAYFSQVFRKHTGLLPSEYRARHGN